MDTMANVVLDALREFISEGRTPDKQKRRERPKHRAQVAGKKKPNKKKSKFGAHPRPKRGPRRAMRTGAWRAEAVDRAEVRPLGESMVFGPRAGTEQRRLAEYEDKKRLFSSAILQAGPT